MEIMERERFRREGGVGEPPALAYTLGVGADTGRASYTLSSTLFTLLQINWDRVTAVSKHPSTICYISAPDSLSLPYESIELFGGKLWLCVPLIIGFKRWLCAFLTTASIILITSPFET